MYVCNVMRCLLLFSSLFVITCFGQKRYVLIVSNFEAQKNLKSSVFQNKDSIGVLKILQSLQYDALKQGNFLASLDELIWKKDSVYASFYLGPQLTNAKLSIQKKDKNLLTHLTKFNERTSLNLPVGKDLLANSLKSILKLLNTKGFPYAKVFLSNIKIEQNSIAAELNIERGNLVKWKSIEIKGDAKISEKLIASCLNIREDQPFNLEDFENASTRLKQLPFLAQIKPNELLLTENSATLYIYIKNTPISVINGVLGLQQRPTDFKVQFTGDLRVKLQNAFRKGELVDINWRSIQPLSQQLKILTTLPFLFRTNFGFDGNFELFKRDTSFLEIKTNVGILYQLGSNIRLKAFYKRISSNVLRSVKAIPDLVSVSSNNYGLQFLSQSLDYLPNPRKGFYASLEGTVGLRQTKSLDISIRKKSTTYSIQCILQRYTSLSTRNVIKTSLHIESYFAPTIFRNEALRFGGQNSQRGFNEDVLLSSTRATASIEYRFLLDKNSYLFSFVDQSWFERNISGYYNDSPTGFGLGLTFGTNVGVFSISYAMGKQKSSELLLKNGKIHFGYVAFF